MPTIIEGGCFATWDAVQQDPPLRVFDLRILEEIVK